MTNIEGLTKARDILLQAWRDIYAIGDIDVMSADIRDSIETVINDITNWIEAEKSE